MYLCMCICIYINVCKCACMCMISNHSLSALVVDAFGVLSYLDASQNAISYKKDNYYEAAKVNSRSSCWELEMINPVYEA